MKKFIASILLAVVLLISSAGFADARVTRVRSYIRKSTGTYVAPHYKTSSNRTKLDNWSTKGNYNPYTGKKGYTSPYKSYRTHRIR